MTADEEPDEEKECKMYSVIYISNRLAQQRTKNDTCVDVFSLFS